MSEQPEQAVEDVVEEVVEPVEVPDPTEGVP